MINKSIENYPLFLLLGIIGWGFFDKATAFSLVSIVGKPQLVKKIYFPREVLVISACLTALMMSLIEFCVFGVFLLGFNVLHYAIGYGNAYILPTWVILLFPVIILVEFALALGVSLTIASLNVIWRDVQWIWPVVMQAGFFLTPVMYSMATLNGIPFARLLALNPMAGILDSLRYSLIGMPAPIITDIAYVAVFAFVLLLLGGLIFSRMEPKFAEEV